MRCLRKLFQHRFPLVCLSLLFLTGLQRFSGGLRATKFPAIQFNPSSGGAGGATLAQSGQHARQA